MTGDVAGESPRGEGPGMSALLPGRVGMFVRLVAQPGARAGLLDALHRYMDELDAEQGTEAFLVALDPDEEDIVWLFEWFTDEPAMEAHRSTAAFDVMMRELAGVLAAPPALVRIDPLRVHLQRVVTEGRTVSSVFDS